MQSNTYSGKSTAETNLTVNYNMSNSNSPLSNRSSSSTSVTRITALSNSYEEDKTLNTNF